MLHSAGAICIDQRRSSACVGIPWQLHKPSSRGATCIGTRPITSALCGRCNGSLDSRCNNPSFASIPIVVVVDEHIALCHVHLPKPSSWETRLGKRHILDVHVYGPRCGTLADHPKVGDFHVPKRTTDDQGHEPSREGTPFRSSARYAFATPPVPDLGRHVPQSPSTDFLLLPASGPFSSAVRVSRGMVFLGSWDRRSRRCRKLDTNRRRRRPRRARQRPRSILRRRKDGHGAALDGKTAGGIAVDVLDSWDARRCTRTYELAATANRRGAANSAQQNESGRRGQWKGDEHRTAEQRYGGRAVLLRNHQLLRAYGTKLLRSRGLQTVRRRTGWESVRVACAGLLSHPEWRRAATAVHGIQ